MPKLKQIDRLFHINVAKSKGVDSYPSGDVPFVTSTELNNGVVAYVSPGDDDRVFEGPAIAISGLGFATVQLSTFLPKGNGGDSLTILLPKSKRSVEYLLRFAAAFNVVHGWRFSFGRKCSVPRLRHLFLPDPPPTINEVVKEEATSLKTVIGKVNENLKVKTEPKNVEG